MGPSAATQTPRWQFTVDDFARMGESGIFRAGDRVEVDIPGVGLLVNPVADE